MKDTRINNDLRGSVRYKKKILELLYQSRLSHFNWRLNLTIHILEQVFSVDVSHKQKEWPSLLTEVESSCVGALADASWRKGWWGVISSTVCGWDLAKDGQDLDERLERLTANAKVATVLGSITASSHCEIWGAADEAVYIKKIKKIHLLNSVCLTVLLTPVQCTLQSHLWKNFLKGAQAWPNRVLIFLHKSNLYG